MRCDGATPPYTHSSIQQRPVRNGWRNVEQTKEAKMIKVIFF